MTPEDSRTLHPFARLPADWEAVAAELAADRVDGCRETIIGRVQQADQPDHQRAGVQRRGAIGLGEGAALRVVGPREDLIVDLPPGSAPSAAAAPPA